jgi:hypothetical protein
MCTRRPACSAALAVLDVIAYERLVANAAQTGAYLRQQQVDPVGLHARADPVEAVPVLFFGQRRPALWRLVLLAPVRVTHRCCLSFRSATMSVEVST